MSKKYSLRRTLAALLAVLLLTTACAPAALASFKAKINSSSARIYNVPSTSSKINVRAPKNLTVTVTAYAKGWARIRLNGHTGYIPLKYLNLAKRIKAYAAKSTPVYRSASSSSSKMGTIPLGTAVYVVGKSGGYYRVQNGSGSVTGYVSTKNLASKAQLTAAYKAWKKAQSNSSSGSNSGGASLTKLQKAVALAVSYVGRPYAIDDNPPSSFNCSSLLKYCMEKYGYPMKDLASAQANDGRYKKVTSGYRLGDILCFDTDEDGECDHTALYMGDNRFVEASQNANKVQINTLTDWYKSHLLWARRP